MRTAVIGSSRAQKLPSLVLEHTIRKTSAPEIQVLHTYDLRVPTPKNPAHRSRTGFSFNRFAIPDLVAHKGVAAYLECDQIVFRDLAGLFDIPFDGATVLRTKVQTSVLLLDCERLRWDVERIIGQLDAGAFSYKALMDDLCVEPAKNIRAVIPESWNSLEKYVPDKTCLLHYTEMDCQPWRLWWPHPLKELWLRALKSAMKAGAVSHEVLREEVALKHVVPQLLEAAKEWGFPSTP